MTVTELLGTRPGTGGGTRPDPSDASGTQLGRVPLPRYFDVAALLDGNIPEPKKPTIGIRTDGRGIFYPEEVNNLFGDPEGGKTLLTDMTTADELNDGGRILRLDLDHNGPGPTVNRLLEFGASPSALRDPERFRYIEPEDRRELIAVVDHMQHWRPTLVVVDSLGELIPLFGGSSNSADDFTNVHRQVIKPLVKTGACVIVIDHLAKGDDSRAFGAGGTAAKKRAIGGSSIRVKVDVPFTPGKGGSAFLTVNKDRHGGLRQHCPVGDREPLAGKFVIWHDEHTGLRAEIKAPSEGERNPDESAPEADIQAVGALDPPPTSANDARERLKWRGTRARAAFKAWKATQ